ncbi:histidine phosphatase family protein [Paenibacillus chibensis]|uniref:histidine phosphatase family protein n=1 Tax=Paenibacillus chibensis TaxID=59846 RepID=UPI000FD77938|nr:histidine phosphatase family protein [Paenibacillus chibensis]MEC0370617.1 histidine phosphatase family protein [Paenibacillus chibensis]
MKTYIYMVRHGESPKTEGNERTRGLTEKGLADTARVSNILRAEGVQTFVSSPYTRAVLTIEGAARDVGKEVIIYEGLKERVFASEENITPDHELYSYLDRMFMEPELPLPGDESNAMCQKRSVAVLKEILNTYAGQKIAIGTHGIVMTLMMGYFDDRYGLDFLLQTSKPDIYRMEFEGERFIAAKRLMDELAL